MRPNHRKDLSSDGHDGIMVEALKVLPCCLAPLDDGVRTLPPAVGLSSHLQVDTVKHWLNCGNYNVQVLLLSLGLLHQHVELRLGFMTIACKCYNVPSYQKTTSTVTPTRRYSPFSSSASLSARSDSFAFPYWICSMVWRSWPSSASCSASKTVITKIMVVQQLQSTFANIAYRISARIHF